MLSRQGGSDDPTTDGHIREKLLRDVHPDPSCPDATRAPEPGKGQVAISVVRVVKGCLRYTTEAVAKADVDTRLAKLRDDPQVVAADRIVKRKPEGVDAPSAPSAGPTDQWALAPEHLYGEKVRSLWPASAGDLKVAIIDTGIDQANLDLASQVVERAPWVHLYKGDDDMHGSHVGGIVAAAADGAGVVGLTPKARLMDVQYWDNPNVDDENHHLAGPSDDLGEYVRWAVDHGADVVNMSLGGAEPSDTELTAVLYAEQQGVIVAAASGNCGGKFAGHKNFNANPCEHRNEVKYPAGYDTVLSVGAHTEDDEKAGFSSANGTVDVSAPGDKIASDCLATPDDNRVTCEQSGTSMATPYVSATAALLKARHPEASPEAIRTAITRSARTDDRQPVGKRTDAFGWGIVDPEAAAKYLDDHPGAPRKQGPAAQDRTQVAYVQLGGPGNDQHQLMVLDDGIAHPVRTFGESSSTSRIDWSDDHSQLVSVINDTLFSWTGPGSTAAEAPCQSCDAAYVSGMVVTLGPDGTLTWRDPATLKPTGSTKLAFPGPDEPYVLYGDVGGKLLVAHATSSDSSGPDQLWLVDLGTGKAVASHGGGSNTQVGNVAVDAAGDQVAYVGGERTGPCNEVDRVHLLHAGGLKEVAQPQQPTSSGGDLEVQDLFFNGKALYATMKEIEVTGSDSCRAAGSAGLFRLDDDHRGWSLVDDDPVLTVRPVEGLTGDPDTGKVVVPEEGQKGTFAPTGARGDKIVQLGVVGQVWSTPTRDEVDLGRSGSTPPIDHPTTPTTTGSSGGGRSKEAAIARFETFLHALGKGDIDTLCDIGGPAAKKAEDEGFGTCPQTMAIMQQMISPAQHEALKTARIDPGKVTTPGPGQVHIPVDAIVADVTFTEEELGDTELAYQNGNWFVVD